MQFNSLFSNIERGRKLVEVVKFFNPYDDDSLSQHNYKAISRKRLVNAFFSGVIRNLKAVKRYERNVAISAPSGVDNISDHSSSNVARLVIDSLTHLLILIRERTLMQFVMDIAYLLKNFNAPAILTLTTSSLDQQSLVRNLGSVLDGVIETKIKEDANDVVIRSIRVQHI
jgi:hypothetical protein